MHQCLIQWHGDDVELVHTNESVSIATADSVFWELGDFECFSGKIWEGGFIRVNNKRGYCVLAPILNLKCDFTPTFFHFVFLPLFFQNEGSVYPNS